MGFPGPNSNHEGQREQARVAKLGKRLGPDEADLVLSASGAFMNGRGGAYSEGCWNKQDGLRVLGVGPIQQVEPGVGSKERARFLPRLKESVFPGPRARISRSPDVLKAGSGLKEGLKWQQVGAHKISTDGAASLVGLIGPELPRLQAGPSNRIRELKAGKRGLWGLNKVFNAARSGTSGDDTGSKEGWRMEEGGASPSVKGSSDLLVDPAWVCAREPLLQAIEGLPGLGGTPSFESCWEKGLWMVPSECPVMGGSGQGNAAEGFSDGSSLALVETVPKSPKVDEHKSLRIHATGPRFETLSSADCSSPLFSVFGRPLLSEGSSGLGDFLENDTLGDMEHLRVVSVDGREWGKGIANALMEDVQESMKEEPAKNRPECMGYNNREDSCLFKFSEFLGVTTVGFEEEILKLMRKLEAQQEGDKRKGYPTETRCERELRKLECTVNYNGKSQNRGGRDRGNFLLKLK